MAAQTVSRPSREAPTVALMLQGGGALGAYHIGAYQAMAEHDLHPDWVASISIGAIDAAIIAGNRPEQRIERLAALWEAISWPDLPTQLPLTAWQTLHNMASNAEALLFGQPHFFTPRPVNPLLVPQAAPQQVSFFDITPMLFILRRFADFSLINSRVVRLSLGATNIATGDLEFFDNHRQMIGPEYVLASGSLPPGFPGHRGEREALLGRRLRFQHAARCGRRRTRASAHGRVPDRSLGRRRGTAADDQRCAVARQADPVCEPHGTPGRCGGDQGEPAPRGAMAAAGEAGASRRAGCIGWGGGQ